MTSPATEPTHRELPRLAFFTLGAEEAVAIAANQAEEILESELAAQGSMDGPRHLPLVGGALVPDRRSPGPAANDRPS